LCATYHAAHLLNLERVLHAVSKKYGLVHELSLQCKPRDVDRLALQAHKRRTALFSIGNDPEDDDGETGCPLVERFESGFNVWAYIKYYSVLHAALAVKELSQTKLVTGQRLKAQFIKRNSTSSPVKAANPASTAAGATTGAAVGSTAATATPSSIASSNTPTIAAAPRSWYPLAHHRCLELCNYFLGFNNWSCSIQSIRPYDPLRDEDLMDDSQRDSTMLKASTADKFKYSSVQHATSRQAGRHAVWSDIHKCSCGPAVCVCAQLDCHCACGDGRSAVCVQRRGPRSER